MKKIIAIAALFLAFSFNANAQVASKVKPKTEAITQESITKDHSALIKTVTMNESLKNDMMTLLNMRMEAVNAAKEEDKKAIYDRYGLKILSGLTPEQLNQFKSNKALYLKLTEY
jgi:aspartate/tyrosine/aromatic aminotransferase